MFSFFKKKSVAYLMSRFTTLRDDLRDLAAKKMAEAEAHDADAQAVTAAAKLKQAAHMVKVEAAELEAEAALNIADRIDSLLGTPVAATK